MNHQNNFQSVSMQRVRSGLFPAVMGLCLLALITVSIQAWPQSEKLFQKEKTVASQSAEVLTDSGAFLAQVNSAVSALAETPFPQITTLANAYVVYDIAHDQVLGERAGYASRPLASLAKIMTALVALEYGDPAQDITISLEAIQMPGDQGLVAGETWKLGDLIEFMLVSSSNDAAYAISQNLVIDNTANVTSFVQRMNEFGEKMKLTTLKFSDPTGLDDGNNSPSSFGSAYDVAKLLAFANDVYPEIFESTRYASLAYGTDSAEKTAENTNKVSSQLPSLIAGKTGYTNSAGGNLAVILDIGLGRPIAIVVLGSTFEGRFTDVEQLAQVTRTYIDQVERKDINPEPSL